MANTLNLFRNGAVGFIDWLGLRILLRMRMNNHRDVVTAPMSMDPFDDPVAPVKYMARFIRIDPNLVAADNAECVKLVGTVNTFLSGEHNCT